MRGFACRVVTEAGPVQLGCLSIDPAPVPGSSVCCHAPLSCPAKWVHLSSPTQGWSCPCKLAYVRATACLALSPLVFLCKQGPAPDASQCMQHVRPSARMQTTQRPKLTAALAWTMRRKPPEPSAGSPPALLGLDVGPSRLLLVPWPGEPLLCRVAQALAIDALQTNRAEACQREEAVIRLS